MENMDEKVKNEVNEEYDIGLYEDEKYLVIIVGKNYDNIELEEVGLILKVNGIMERADITPTEVSVALAGVIIIDDKIIKLDDEDENTKAALVWEKKK